jgi:hypothetical protein
VRDIWGDEQTRKNIEKLVQIGVAHISRVCAPHEPHHNVLFNFTLQSHEVWNLWKDWEVGKIEALQNAEAKANAVARVDEIFLERTRQIHIGSYLVYSTVDSIPQVTIDYRATNDSYSNFVTTHFPDEHYEEKLDQSIEIRKSALQMLSWKAQKITREQLELKAQSGSIEDWKAYILWEKKGKKVQSRLMPVLYERAIEFAASEQWAAILAEDEARIAAAKTALREIWEDYLEFQVGMMCA